MPHRDTEATPRLRKSPLTLTFFAPRLRLSFAVSGLPVDALSSSLRMDVLKADCCCWWMLLPTALRLLI